MKAVKIVLVVIVVAAIVAGAYFFGMKSGADLVRNGLLANYPTVKNVVQSANVEFDTTVSVTLTTAENAEIFNLLKGTNKADSLQISIPYYGRYGIDLSVRNFRVFKNDEGAVEVWLPAVVMRYCELKFDGLVINGSSAATLFKGDNAAEIRKKLYELLLPVLQKNKAHVKAAKVAENKALMFYFMPYKWDLKVYIDNELQNLPLVPGVNQSVDDAIKQAVGK